MLQARLALLATSVLTLPLAGCLLAPPSAPATRPTAPSPESALTTRAHPPSITLPAVPEPSAVPVIAPPPLPLSGSYGGVTPEQETEPFFLEALPLTGNLQFPIVQPALTPFAGAGLPGHLDGAPLQARFHEPIGIAIVPRGLHRHVFVSDRGTSRIRRITTLPDGSLEVATLAGTGERGLADGPAASATFHALRSLTADDDGHLYVADSSTVRRLVMQYDPQGAITGATVETLAGAGFGHLDGPGAQARFAWVVDIATDGPGDTLYVTDALNHSIRRLSRQPDQSYTVDTIAGTGVLAPPASPAATVPGDRATFTIPMGLTLDRATSTLYVADRYYGIRTVAIGADAATTTVGTLVSGLTLNALDAAAYPDPVYNPLEVIDACMGADGSVYYTDIARNWISRLDVGGPVRASIHQGTAPEQLTSITEGPAGALYFTNYRHHVVRELTIPAP